MCGVEAGQSTRQGQAVQLIHNFMAASILRIVAQNLHIFRMKLTYAPTRLEGEFSPVISEFAWRGPLKWL